MMVIDGRGYAMGGLVGSFTVDAGIGIVACLLILVAGRLSTPLESPFLKEKWPHEHTEVST
jgi:hypothetical protein